MADTYGIGLRPHEAAEALALALKITEGINNHTVTAEFFSNLLKYEYKIKSASGVLEDQFIQYTPANFADFTRKAAPIIQQNETAKNYFTQCKSLLSDTSYHIVATKLRVLKRFLDDHQFAVEMPRMGYTMVGTGYGGIAIYQKSS